MKFKNDVEIQNSDLTISNTGSAHLILNGDSNNSGDTGQEDAIIDFLGDAGDYGYRLNSENYSQKSAFNIQENRDSTYTSRLYIDEDGDVGIGTTNPQAQLNVVTGSTVRTWAPISGTSAIFESSDSSRAFVSIVGVNQSELLFGDAGSQTPGRVRYNHSDNKLSLWANGSQHVTVDNTGNVGIGTTSPDAKLEITTLRESGIRLSSSDTTAAVNELLSGIDFYSPDSLNEGIKASIKVNYADVSANSYMTFSTGANTERMRIDEGGNVGIGTTSPDSNLEVAGSTGSNTVLHVRNDSTGSTRLKFSNSTDTNANGFQIINNAFNGSVNLLNYKDTPLALWTNSSQRLTILSNGNVGIGTTDPKVLLHLRKDTATAGSESIILLDNRQGPSTSNYYSGGLWGAGYRDVANPGYLAGIDFLRTSQSGGLSSQGEMIFYTTTIASTLSSIRASNERMRIDSIGNVGIGTTDPTSKLHISSSTSTDTPTAGTTNGGLFISNASRTYGLNLGVQNTGRSWIQGQRMDGNTSLYDLLLQPLGGNVGIGTDSPGAKLEVYGSSPNILINNTTETDSGIVFTDAQAGTSQRAAIKFNSSDQKLKFFVNDEVAQRMVIDTAGYVGIGTTNPSYQLQLSTNSAAKPSSSTWTVVSDERVKENIKPYEKGLNEILQVNTKTFDYNGKAGFDKIKDNVGIIAQDMIKIFPETIKTYNAKLNETDEEEAELYNFDGHALTFALINAVKELKAEIEELKKQINK